jgi:hypothetical protein
MMTPVRRRSWRLGFFPGIAGDDLTYGSWYGKTKSN